MNKSVLLGVIAVLVILIAVLLYMTLKSAQKTPIVPVTSKQTAIKEEVVWKPDGVVSKGEYDQELELAEGRFKVYWKTDGEYLYMALVGKTKGWVAIGFEPTKRMKDADMVIGWVKDGKATVIDAYSTGETGPHPPDEKLGGRNDILSYGGSEKSGVTTIEFKRKLSTGDKYDKDLKLRTKIAFIFAMADEDMFTKKHNVAKGSGELSLGG